MSESVEKRITPPCLKPYFKKLLDLVEKKAGDRDSVTISLGERKLIIDSWEKAVFHKAAPLFSGEKYSWETLVIESLCLLAKLLRDMHLYEKAKKEGNVISDKILSALAMDKEIGFQLLTELQIEVNNMVLVIDLDSAKKLTKFRFSVRKKLSLLKLVSEDIDAPRKKSVVAS